MTTQEQAIDLLQQVPLFEGLSKRDLKRVAGQMRERTFNAREDIVREGDRGGGFFLIVRGNVKVMANGRTRRTLGPGDSFGEIALIDKGPRTATVRAGSQVEAFSLTTANFLSILEENWSIAHKVMEGLCSRIRQLERSIT